MKKIILFLLLHISVVVNAQNDNYQVYMGGDAKATLTGNDVYFHAQIPNGCTLKTLNINVYHPIASYHSDSNSQNASDEVTCLTINFHQLKKQICMEIHA